MWTDLARRRDAGMALPEVLVSVLLIGLIATVIGAAITVTFRQTDATEGRVSLARAEQSIDTWIPADLASTDVTADFEALYGVAGLLPVDTSPSASPCGDCTGIDMSGANALQLAWFTAGSVLTQVQYQYIQVGDEWQLQRIECVGGQPCTRVVVLHDLDPPPDPDSYDPNTVRPTWVLSTPELDDPADLELAGDAQRIVVTINGGGTGSASGGGTNTISLTAGGVATSDIAADDFTVPSFVRAKTRCGGPVTLIVDDSGSITQGNVDAVVLPGVTDFIEAFRGTPTRVQVIQFSTKATTLGPTTDDPSGWHRYIDMTDDDDVSDLLADVANRLTANGATNWEDAFFRALKENDGSTALELPSRIVFFTDGKPTLNRTTELDGYSAGEFRNGALVHYNNGPYGSSWPSENGSAFHQESWDRADVILDDHRGIDLVFVGVGPGLTKAISWIHNPATYEDSDIGPSPAENWIASETISGLLTNLAFNEVEADYDGSQYTNAEVADFYLQSSFDGAAFGAAMRASALKDCGGTLTIQTRLPDGSPVAEEFVYENSEYRDDDGTVVSAESRVVTTSATFRTGTLDFEIPSSTNFFSVDVVPQELQTLSGYSFEGWSCRAGADPKTDLPPITIPDSDFQGITVDVAANEAVSCILTVSAT